MDEQQVTAPDAIALPEETIELPVTQNGIRIRVRVRGLNSAATIVAQRLVPIMLPGSNQGDFTPIEQLEQGAERARGMAAAGLVAPPFSFDQREPGKAFWDDLVAENQMAVVTAISRLSRGPAGADAEVAARLAGFPGSRAGGAPAGAPPSLPVPAGPAPAPAPRPVAVGPRGA